MGHVRQGLRAEDMVVVMGRRETQPGRRPGCGKLLRKAAEILRSLCTQGPILSKVGVGERGGIIGPWRNTEVGRQREGMTDTGRGRGRQAEGKADSQGQQARGMQWGKRE